MVNKYSSSGDEHLCKATSHKEECGNLVFGTLVRQLQKLGLWPGNPKSIIQGMSARSVKEVMTHINGIRNYIYPDITSTNKRGYLFDYMYYNHISCPKASDVQKAAEVVAKKTAAAVLESYQGYLDGQKQKLWPVQLQTNSF